MDNDDKNWLDQELRTIFTYYEVGDGEQLGIPPRCGVDQILNQGILIRSVSFHPSSFGGRVSASSYRELMEKAAAAPKGEYARMRIAVEDTGKNLIVSTGACKLLEVLHALVAHSKLSTDPDRVLQVCRARIRLAVSGRAKYEFYKNEGIE